MSQEKSTVQCECNPPRGFHCSKCWPHWLDPIIKEQAITMPNKTIIGVTT